MNGHDKASTGEHRPVSGLRTSTEDTGDTMYSSTDSEDDMQILESSQEPVNASDAENAGHSSNTNCNEPVDSDRDNLAVQITKMKKEKPCGKKGTSIEERRAVRFALHPQIITDDSKDNLHCPEVFEESLSNLDDSLEGNNSDTSSNESENDDYNIDEIDQDNETVIYVLVALFVLCIASIVGLLGYALIR